MRDVRDAPGIRPPLTLRAGVVRIGATLVWTVSVGTAPCLARDDAQSWNAAEFSKRLGQEWEIFFVPELRLRDDVGELFYHEYRQGLRWKRLRHLHLGLNYLFFRDESSGKPLEEHTGELDVIPHGTMGPVGWSVRARLELRTIQGSPGEQEWRVRLMPKLAFPTRLAGHPITPFVSNDLFYDYSRDAVNQNRLSLGAFVPLGNRQGAEVGVELYYMLQSRRGARRDWSGNHVLGTKWSVRF